MSMIADPTRKYGGKSETLSNTEMSLLSLGAGLLYYFERFNLHVSGAVGTANLRLLPTSSNSYGSRGITDYGFSTNFMVGKEWWFVGNVGVGVAAKVRFASMKMTYYDARMKATDVSLLFSVTNN